jgi:hypothetical protein
MAVWVGVRESLEKAFHRSGGSGCEKRDKVSSSRRSFSAYLILPRHDYGATRSAKVRQKGFDFDRTAIRKLHLERRNHSNQ